MEIQNEPIEALVQRIDEILQRNGEVTQKTKDVLMFSVVKALLLITREQHACTEQIMEQQKTQDKRIEMLETRNIVTWCLRHPLVSTFILTILGLLVFSHYGSIVLAFIGVKVP